MYDAKPSLWSSLRALILHIIPDLSHEALSDILVQRARIDLDRLELQAM